MGILRHAVIPVEFKLVSGYGWLTDIIYFILTPPIISVLIVGAKLVFHKSVTTCMVN